MSGMLKMKMNLDAFNHISKIEKYITDNDYESNRNIEQLSTK